MDDQIKYHTDSKEPKKETAQNKYWPITCLPKMWKILTEQIKGMIYYSLTSRLFFPGEQKGCREGSRGTAESHYIYQHIQNESKSRRENLALAYIV